VIEKGETTEKTWSVDDSRRIPRKSTKEPIIHSDYASPAMSNLEINIINSSKLDRLPASVKIIEREQP